MVCFKAINQKRSMLYMSRYVNQQLNVVFVQGIICSDCAISSCEHGINKNVLVVDEKKKMVKIGKNILLNLQKFVQ